MTPTPEQIEIWFQANWSEKAVRTAYEFYKVNADIVQQVAEIHWSIEDDFCPFCDEDFAPRGCFDHSPDCLHLAARKLRGLDG